MSELDEKLLNRIKDEIAIENGFKSWRNIMLMDTSSRLWPEVCRRYAEEMMYTRLASKPIIKTLNEQISQLKKQLEEANDKLDGILQYKERTESKLEVKEKCITCEAQEKFFDAAIAERDEKIKELIEKLKNNMPDECVEGWADVKFCPIRQGDGGMCIWCIR